MNYIIAMLLLVSYTSRHNHLFYFAWFQKTSTKTLIFAFNEVERKPNFLACDFAELVALCKVMFWKTHIPVRTQKWPPHLIFAGACHGVVINYVTA